MEAFMFCLIIFTIVMLFIATNYISLNPQWFSSNIQKSPLDLFFFSQLTQTETHKVIYDDPKTFFLSSRYRHLFPSYMGHPSLLIQVQRNDPCYNETSAFSSRSSQTKQTGKHEKLHNHTIKLTVHNKNVIEGYNIHSQNFSFIT